MNEYGNRTFTENTMQGFGRRVSWGAVFAGLMVALVTQLTLNILGLGIGSGMLNLEDNQSDKALGMSAVIWVVATSLISLFLGGWTAGRLAGVPRGPDSWLHGILTWCSYTLIVFSLLTTAVGGLVSGIAGVLGKGLAATGQGIARIAPKAMGAAGLPSEQQSGQGQSGINWDAIKQDARQLTQSAAQPNDQSQGAQNAQELQQALERVFNRSGEADPQDREALVNAVAKYTGKSKEEAEQQVAQWEQTYQQARQKAQEVKAKTEEKAREVADTAAHGISRGALWTFGIMVISAAAAGIGGIAGRPKAVVVETTRTA